MGEDGDMSPKGSLLGVVRLCTRGAQLAASVRMRAVNGCLNRNNRVYAQWRKPQRTRHLTERTALENARAVYRWYCTYCEVRATRPDRSSDPTFNCDCNLFHLDKRLDIRRNKARRSISLTNYKVIIASRYPRISKLRDQRIFSHSYYNFM